ncbi:glutaredoxin family protein [Photobacterium sanguinicancri]|uniref:Glutaredoxin family protein n=1 Tax=Photobacterium sanguinicancri TaxID=875932 RepID=A0AAW7Y8U2_9GAMM|nr:glutaredoxin family protein [Photobacterium sanguinicancri]MDO6496867.1 glutaredoxin family protein [Photobacterium sanguinicancri]MDO6543959.1 glutaredoxin family protein [Photobacterium sanguinicancri]OZS42649.1 thioredoxin family protein [Photobacterium sanguinicancri]
MLITLYSTEGCHLCEQAYRLLVEEGVQEHVQVIDIAFDDVLFLRYGVTIPVVSISSEASTAAADAASDDNSLSISELGWPFDRADLAVWLKNNGFN